MKYLLATAILLFCFTGCKTISVNQEIQQITQHKVTLLTIGKEKQVVIHEQYKHEGMLSLSAPIKLNVNKVSFNQKTYKAFEEANTRQAGKVSLTYIDSLPEKPNFIQLRLADKINLLATVNSKENLTVKDYLSVNNDSGIVTQVSIAFSQETLTKITQAEDVFVVQKKYKGYQLALYKNSTLTETIPFEEGVVFGYKLNYFCWKENDHHQIEVVGLSASKQACPSDTYSKAKRAKKKINYFKL